jgi:hypothetical protein
VHKTRPSGRLVIRNRVGGGFCLKWLHSIVRQGPTPQRRLWFPQLQSELQSAEIRESSQQY